MGKSMNHSTSVRCRIRDLYDTGERGRVYETIKISSKHFGKKIIKIYDNMTISSCLIGNFFYVNIYYSGNNEIKKYEVPKELCV